MSTSENSESRDSMDDDITQVPRATRSKVWEHYEQELVEVDDELKAVCKYCGAKLLAKFGTSSLRNHTADSCRSIDDASRKRFLETIKTNHLTISLSLIQKFAVSLWSSFASMLRSPF